MKIGIVIPVYNQVARLRECLGSIRDTAPGHHDLTVFVVDSGSEEDVIEAVEAELGNYPETPHYKIQRLDSNRGVTIPWNVGVREAIAHCCGVICVCNSDVVFGPETIAHCAEAIRDHGVGACFPFSIQGGPKPADFKIESARRAQWGLKPDHLVRTGGFAGWCFFIARDVFERLGLFDERFTLWYQDTDFHRRLCEAGIHPVEVRACLLHHYESSTIKALPGQFEHQGWRAQDEKRFFEKWPKR